MVNITEKTKQKLLNSEVLKISINHKSESKEVNVHNVAGVIKGKSSNSAVLVTAHFDHTGNMGEQEHQGALDNASGVATMLNLINIFMNSNEELPSDIVFCALNGEETGGLPGSSVFAEDFVKRYESSYNINIDCVGGIDCGALALQVLDEKSKELTLSLREILNLHNISHIDTEYGFSDHVEFLKVMPAVVIGQVDIMEVIHTKDDTKEKVDLKELDLLSNALKDFIISYGDKFTKQVEIDDEVQLKQEAELWSEAGQIANEIRDREKLGRYEEYAFSLDSKIFLITGAKPFITKEELWECYPNMLFIPDFEGYSLEYINIDDSSSVDLSMTSDKSIPLEEKYNIAKYCTPNLVRITISYVSEDTHFEVRISNGEFQESMFEKQENVDDNLWLGRIYNQSDYYNSFLYKSKDYSIIVRFYDSEETIIGDIPVILSKQYEKEEIIKMYKDMNLHAFAKGYEDWLNSEIEQGSVY